MRETFFRRRTSKRMMERDEKARNAIPSADLARRAVVASLVLLVLGLLAWSWFERQVAASFDRVSVEAATRVYGRPVSLETGARVDPSQLETHLRAARYRFASRGRSPDALEPGEVMRAGREWWIHRRSVRLGEAVRPGGLLRVRVDRSGRVRGLWDGTAQPLKRAFLEPPLLHVFAGSRARDRVPVALDELPDHLVQAVLTVEDRRFHRHGGLDLRRIAGAFLANLEAGRVTQGGSTVTQQLARTLFLSRERSLLRKLKEAALALALERRLSKREILDAYLDHIYLGHVDGVAVHGVGSAALRYFGKDASRLDAAESATLAGMIRAPNLYAPTADTASARGRRDFVLRQMARAGALSEERLARALERPVSAAPEVRSWAGERSARYFLDHLRDELAGQLPVGTTLETAGLTVVSSLRPGLQAAAERAVRGGLARIERAHPELARRETPLQGALVAIDPRSGEILAMVGGREYAASQFNRATDARRQPGSAFKPVVALAALTREKEPLTLASLLEDEPLSVQTPSGPWRPANYDGRYEGEITLRRALEESRNVPFARLGLELGPQRIVETARSLGIGGDLEAVPSLALGASEVTVLDLTSAYGVLASEGVRVAPRAAWAVLDAEGRRLDGTSAPAERAVTPAEAYLMTAALRGVVERGTGRGVRAYGYFGPVAAKSGTTNGYRDAWFVGYTPELAVGVWVGFDDGRSVGRPGAAAALPIFATFLRAALGPAGAGEFRIPDGIELAWVDPRGGRNGWGCDPEREVFLEGTVPRNVCGGWRLARELRALGGRTDRDLGRLAERELSRWVERELGRRAARQAAEWAERTARALADAQRRLREWIEAREEGALPPGGGRR